MQKPLGLYFQNTYHTDFGVSSLGENPQISKFAIFYEILKYIDESLAAKFKPKKPQIAHKELKEQEVKGITPDGEISLKITQIDTYLDEPKLEQNLSEPKAESKIEPKIEIENNEITLKSGDEVLFIGDSIMQPIALHAKKMLAKHGIKTTDLSRHSTGLVNKKYFNWQEVSAKELSQNANIKLIFALFGANDPWGRTIEGKYQEFASEAWTNFYAKRVSEIYEVAKSAGARLFWLGTPCMKKQDYALKMQKLNEIFQAASEVYEGRYFATSDVVCQGGNYTSYLQNDKGKSIKVRSPDGIHINMEGSKMVAKRLMTQIRLADENSTK